MSTAEHPTVAMNRYHVDVKIQSGTLDEAHGWSTDILATTHANAIAIALFGAKLIGVDAPHVCRLSADATLTVTCALWLDPDEDIRKLLHDSAE
jgi:hypothetical protein